MPRFGGTTSWEQYRQVFDSIVLSNGWDDATAALQRLSHLEGDAMNVALLVPISRRTSRTVWCPLPTLPKLQMLSGEGPPSVPSQISVVLVDEAKAGGTPRLVCPRDDQDIRLLAGVAKPASVTVYDDSLGSLCIGGMLSSSDIAGRLLSVVPAGISFTVGPRPC